MIRQLRASDLPECAAILCSVYNNGLWQCRWTESAAKAYLTDFFRMTKFVGYVAEEDGAVIGAVFAHEKIWWSGSEAFIEEMFVHPAHQGRGLGTALLGQVEQYVRDHSLQGMTLSTNRYAPAPRFYRKNGFSDCGHVLFMAKETK